MGAIIPLLSQKTFHFDVRHIKLQNFSSTTQHRSNAAKPKATENKLFQFP